MTGTMPPEGSLRGQAGIIGYVLLLVMVLAGAAFTVYAGSVAIEQVQSDQRDVNAEITMERVDSQLSTLTTSDESRRGRLSFGDADRGTVRVVRRGFVNVTVNQNATCATSIPLSSVRYENGEGQTVAYEAGGVWHRTGNGSAMQTPPDVRFHNGTLDITVVNITGTVNQETMQAVHHADSSRRESARRSQRLFAGPCGQPHNVTLTVRSDFATAWGAYLEDETGLDATVTGDTVVVNFTRSDLPARIDDRRNHVINMSNASYMDEVDIDGNTIRVSKNTSNRYRVFVEPLGGDTLDIGREQGVTNATNISRPPLDVMIVMDESGSMAFGVVGAPDRITAAQDAAQNFTGTLNASTDRVGLVGYSGQGDGPSWSAPSHYAWAYNITAREFLSTDFDAFNDTVDQTTPNGWTAGSAGLDRANTVLQFESNRSRTRTVIFLSDGEFNREDMDGVSGPNEAAERRAEQAAKQGITVYTIGFGDTTDFNASVLQEMANRTGGEYFAAQNASELDSVFQDISTQLVSARQIGKTPTSTNISTGSGDVLPPQIPGDTDHIANASGGFLNVNDPTAPSQFSHSFLARDNESVTFNATTYECAQWEGTGIVRTHNGTSFQVTRCANVTTVDHNISSDNATVRYDGDNITSLLASDDPAWWQDDLRDVVESHPDVNVTASNTLEMQSNQALVVLDYPDHGEASNRLVLLYEIGMSEEAATYDDVINVRVENVTVTP